MQTPERCVDEGAGRARSLKKCFGEGQWCHQIRKRYINERVVWTACPEVQRVCGRAKGFIVSHGAMFPRLVQRQFVAKTKQIFAPVRMLSCLCCFRTPRCRGVDACSHCQCKPYAFGIAACVGIHVRCPMREPRAHASSISVACLKVHRAECVKKDLVCYLVGVDSVCGVSNKQRHPPVGRAGCLL